METNGLDRVDATLPDELEALVARVRAAARPVGPTIVCIAGGTSTGKSTQIAAPLVRALGPDARLLAQDMQQRSLREQADPRYGFDHPEIYGIEACLRAIERFRAGDALDWPRYDFVRRRHEGCVRVDAGAWLVLEGLHALAPALADAADLCLYAEAPAVVRLVRRILRNQYERYPGLAVPGRTAAGFLGPVLRAHRDLVRPQRAAADLCVRTDRAFARLRDRFELAPITAGAGVETIRRVAFDARTTVAALRDEAGAWRLRVEEMEVCHADWAIGEDTAAAFAELDPEET